MSCRLVGGDSPRKLNGAQLTSSRGNDFGYAQQAPSTLVSSRGRSFESYDAPHAVEDVPLDGLQGTDTPDPQLLEVTPQFYVSQCI